MDQLPRREFLRSVGAAAMGAAISPAADPQPKFAGIQVGAASFVDEGVWPRNGNWTTPSPNSAKPWT